MNLIFILFSIFIILNLEKGYNVTKYDKDISHIINCKSHSLIETLG